MTTRRAAAFVGLAVAFRTAAMCGAILRSPVFRKEEDVKIQVLGTGCAKCKKLYAEAEKAIAASGAAAELEKVERIDQIAKYGVMATPALVVDGEVKASGRVPTSAEIVSWIATAAARASS